MPNIKPVSELRNYGEVLRDVAVGQPVFLTKNGHGRYAVIDIEEYHEFERMKAMDRLLSALDEGRLSGERDGWLPAEEVLDDLEEQLRGWSCGFPAGKGRYAGDRDAAPLRHRRRHGQRRPGGQGRRGHRYRDKR